MRVSTPIYLALLLAACGAPSPCARSTECASGRVCGLDGRCVRLGSPAGARFAGSRWLTPVDWGVAGRRRALGDGMPLGGRAATEGLVAFGPMPASSEILRALLVVQPLDPHSRIDARHEVVVEQVEPFRGGALPARPGAGPLRFAAGRHALAPGPVLPLRIDVTEAARAAADRADRRLHLLLRLREGSARPLVLASPWAIDPQLRPRVELMLH
ncbi:MAG TPA: hypothetical protein DEF51_12595 [Myxococcales bacterium]|nr:hypothetical protein [Myxococcales bacterium]